MMVWFNFLKEEGYFNPDNNPEPLKVNDGYQIPYWDALSYLEKLAVQIKEGKELESIDEILNIIKNTSEHPKDNYRTWYIFIKILSYIPNDKLPKEILNYIPIWFSGIFDTTLQTSELCEKLLPKFLLADPTNEDTVKAEFILKYLFTVELKEKSEVEANKLGGRTSSYKSRLYLHYLTNALIKKNLVERIAINCSDNIILFLADTLKKLLLDYPEGINVRIKQEEREVQVKVVILDKDLSISSNLDDYKKPTYIHNYEIFEAEELKRKLIEALKSGGLEYSSIKENEESIERILYHLNIDFTSALGLTPIKKLGDQYHRSDKVIDVFSLIFRDILKVKVKQAQNEAIPFLNLIFSGNTYRLPFYKRILIYIITDNWLLLKAIFWDLVKYKDGLKLFSDFKYQKEMYDLVSKNQLFFTLEEIKFLEEIIDNGPQYDPETKSKEYPEHWKLKWYSALNKIDPFKGQYQIFSKKLNRTSEQIETEGEITFSGSISPLTKDEILNMSNDEIVKYIHDFKPADRWKEPSIDGLLRSIEEAVKEDPQKFSKEIELYKDAYYVYVYHIISAFGEAWKKKKDFDWNRLLIFCKEYISNERFYSERLFLEQDDFNATSDWVVGAIGNLLTAGMQSDDNAFDIQLMPLAKEIIIILTSNLKPVEKEITKDTDFPTYSLNSTAGKVLRALVDYSLRLGRNIDLSLEDSKWESDIKSLFKETLDKEIIDGYILQGMYFQQFYFLEKIWIKEQIDNYRNLEEKKWVAFMGGFAFANPPSNNEQYELMYPHYERAINVNNLFKNFYDQSLIRHLVAFYFWELEGLEEGSLIFKFLNQASPNSVGDLVHLVWVQREHIKALSEDERERFDSSILHLWEYIAKKYENSNVEEEQKVMGGLSNLIEYISELNEKNVSLILKSTKNIDRYYFAPDLIKNLITLKSKGNPKETAGYIGQILIAVFFREHLITEEIQDIISLVTFLYDNDQKSIGNEICHRLSRHGLEFLRETYYKYNP
jgi:hypothetical protein